MDLDSGEDAGGDGRVEDIRHRFAAKPLLNTRNRPLRRMVKLEDNFLRVQPFSHFVVGRSVGSKIYRGVRVLAYAPYDRVIAAS